MSSSNENSAIFLTDTPAHIQEKIKTHAFSGGQMTKKLQEEKGADLEADVSFQWLCFFMEDDEELEYPVLRFPGLAALPSPEGY